MNDEQKLRLRKTFNDIVFEYSLQKEDLAITAGISYNTLYRWIEGQQSISWENWINLILVLPREARRRYLGFLLEVLDSSWVEADVERKRILFLQLAEEFADLKRRDLENPS